MTILVTGSSGHLGEALMRVLHAQKRPARGLDVRPGPFTDQVGSITDRAVVDRALRGVEVVLHTATLHKPHVVTHSRQAFVDVNITGTLNLLEAAAAGDVRAFVFTSTTSVYGDALVPPVGEPAAWIDEQSPTRPKNIYGVTKTAAEDLCQLFHRNHGLACLVLRTSRFFPEADDDPLARSAFADANLKANEFLHRRVDVEDVVAAHLLAMERAADLGFRRYLISATTPFLLEDLPDLRVEAPAVVERRVPGWAQIYDAQGWVMSTGLDRVYVNDLARRELGWRPRWDFQHVLARLATGQPMSSDLARSIGMKGYHAETFADGPYPVA